MSAKRTGSDLHPLIDQIDKHIRAGEARTACEKLNGLLKYKIDRKVLARVANLSWRVGMTTVGVRLLHPIVRSEKLLTDPTTEELAEYAQCLTRIGAVEEAFEILKELPEVGQVPFYRASALIGHWNYKDAVPWLLKFVRAKETSNYLQLVGRINLAASFLFVREYTQSEILIREALHETALKKFWLLYANCLELSAQAFLVRKKWKEVERFLCKSAEVLDSTDLIDGFFMKKWEVFYEVVKSKGSKDSLLKLTSIRNEAAKWMHWETLRQCDEYEAKTLMDTGLATRLYVGTPFQPYREDLQFEFGNSLDIPERFRWILKKGRGQKVVDLESIASALRGIKPGGLVHKVLGVLCKDFYRPLRIAVLFRELYKGEVYHPTSSPARIHEAIKRLKQVFQQNKLPITVTEMSGAYQLRANAPLSLWIPTTKEYDKWDPLLLKLKAKWPDKPFSTVDAAKILRIPYRSVHRMLEAIHNKGKIEKMGRNRLTRYQMKKTG